MGKNTSLKYKILEIDPLLQSFENDIDLRMKNYMEAKSKILKNSKNLNSFSNGHLYFGFHKTVNGWYYREWAPNAESLFLIGDFNEWNRTSHPLEKKEDGIWEIFIKGKSSLPHKSKVKVQVTANGKTLDRIPLYIKRVIQDPNTFDFNGQIWDPRSISIWNDEKFSIKKNTPLFVYECHIGMAQESEKIGTYKEFMDEVLPKIKSCGFNAIQLMGIMEHPYYASFGYQVSNFFAVSSRFGTPEDLKKLINKAHSMGIAVFLDLIHSHAIKNTFEGINEFDGTDYQFFHSGPKGNHPTWDTKLFNYGKSEVIHFLLSNIKFYMEEYHFDGFRFDGVTSMIYHSHGLGETFGNYTTYFSMNTDTEAITYLQLANELIKEINPRSITIAEDVSGMPGMSLPIKDGGIGFDYRLSMGLPDYWISVLENYNNRKLNMYKLWYELTTRRPGEKNIAYTECHDQALVGDKTLILRLCDGNLYNSMEKTNNNEHVKKGVSLWKLISFSTITLGGEGFLNFMGNEFGHPDWIDFPREGNNWSYKYSRRQWSLSTNTNLKYHYLLQFTKEIIEFVKKYKLLTFEVSKSIYIDDEKKVLVYEKGNLIFIFNFNEYNTYTNYPIPLHSGTYKCIFNTDFARFCGEDRISKHNSYISNDSLKIDLYPYTALVLSKEK